jgi:hypothetical protein
MKSVIASVLVVLGLLSLVIGCGGKLEGIGSGRVDASEDAGGSGEADSSAKDATTAEDAPIATDATLTTSDAELEASIGCTSSGTSALTNGLCTTSVTETCGDTVYQADCACPVATCSCAQMSGASGGGAGGLPFRGCHADCGSGVMTETLMNDALEACGYPVR